MREGCARGEFQWHSNHAGSLVSPGNICIAPLWIHLASLRREGSLSFLLVSYSLTTRCVQGRLCEFVWAFCIPLPPQPPADQRAVRSVLLLSSRFVPEIIASCVFWFVCFVLGFFPVFSTSLLTPWTHASLLPSITAKADRVAFRYFAKSRADVRALLISRHDLLPTPSSWNRAAAPQLCASCCLPKELISGKIHDVSSDN